MILPPLVFPADCLNTTFMVKDVILLLLMVSVFFLRSMFHVVMLSLIVLRDFMLHVAMLRVLMLRVAASMTLQHLDKLIVHQL